jgi:hypothetical protein
VTALGSGSDLWRVDVVLRRTGGAEVDPSALVELLAAASDGPSSADEEVLGGPRPAESYDMPPPEGSVGASCWVRAGSAGEAAQTALDAVVAAARELTGAFLPLWDLRVVPRSAIMSREDYESDR